MNNLQLGIAVVVVVVEILIDMLVVSIYWCYNLDQILYNLMDFQTIFKILKVYNYIDYNNNNNLLYIFSAF